MNVFVVEDSEIVREVLLNMLSEIPGIQLVGTACDQPGAIEQICALNPDVAIIDISLQPGSGVEVLKSVKKHNPAIKVVMLTSCTNTFYLNNCMRLGADYFFDKTYEFMRVEEVLRQLMPNGGAGISLDRVLE